jgi:predicted  nucleic acid-binding Zn-ribbon protein
MITLEELEKVYKSASEEYTTLSAQVEKQNHALMTERDELQKEAKRLYTERQATTQSIPPEPLDLYEKIRVQRHGIAVTTISDNSCDSCGSVITPAQQQSAHHSHQLFRCPSCGRIVYS